ncbi:restriction endonuclease subunit S [Pseudoalteromonas carrageenovora]|uniref:restriction endonuclease subunit S n=1 Tax=Pseudoalteromonas carrageenovora TaxID=227 RepID=UPI002FD0D7E7
MNNNNPTSHQTRFGLLPSDWSCLSLGDLVHDVSYGSSSKSAKVGNVPVLRMGNMQDGFLDWNDLVYTSDAVEISKYELKKNTVLFNRTNTVDLVGKAAIYRGERPAIYAGYLIKINNKPELLNSEYLNYVLNTNQIKSYNKLILSVAVSQANINGQKLKTYPIPVPPHIDEQTAIASALSDVDALLTELEKLIAKKQAIKTASMQQLLTGKTRLPQFATYTEGADEGKRKGTKSSELGKIPEDWDVEKIGSVVSITTGSRNTQDKLSSGKYPFFVRSQTIERIDTYSFDGEAVLTAGDGVGTGKIFHYINGKFDYHQRVYLMHNFGDRIDGYYFYIYFSNFFYDRIMSMTAKSSVDSVRREMIADMLITLPSKEEQVATATILSDMDNEIQTLEQRLTKTRQIKQGMMQQLLTGLTRLPLKKHETEQDGGS